MAGINPVLAANNARMGSTGGANPRGMTRFAPGLRQPTPEQRARFGGMTNVRQPTAEQRARFDGMIQPGYKPAYTPQTLSNMLGAMGNSQPAQAASPQVSSVSTGIQPQTPYTQQDVASAESSMRNMTAQLPSQFQGKGLSGILSSAMGALGNKAASQFAPAASGALAQYDLGSQKAQADALQSWQNLSQNQLGRDLRFNQKQQNWIYSLLSNAARAPEYSY